MAIQIHLKKMHNFSKKWINIYEVLIPYFYCIDKLWSNNYFVKSLNKQCKNKTHAYSEVIHSQNDDFFFVSNIFNIYKLQDVIFTLQPTHY